LKGGEAGISVASGYLKYDDKELVLAEEVFLFWKCPWKIKVLHRYWSYQ
jgi:hypothetical protein